ncbi:MAG: protease modulator HflC [Verrucomicrobia bacterium]|nr:protease modulator HflC [Verrucomicrobiota bacterium]
MKGNQLAVTVGFILLVIFGSVLFFFEVRQSEVAFVSTFGRASDAVFPPGLHGKLPWPIQKVHKFDARVQAFEGKFEEALTSDGKPLMVQVYLGWHITDPQKYYSSFGGSARDAERNLEGLVGSAKNAVVGKHPFAHYVSTDPAQLKFTEVEKQMETAIQNEAQKRYGIKIEFLGIKRLGLPEAITQKVFERMKEERQRLVLKYQGEGNSRAIEITAEANRKRDEALATAEGDATRIRGQAEAEAAAAYRVLEQNPELAIYLQKLSTFEQTMKEKATLILDPRTPPFDLLRGANAPTAPKSNK